MAEQQSSDALKSLGLLSVLEKAHETRTALLLFSFLMFLDSALIIIDGNGVYQFYSGKRSLDSRLILEIILIFVFFSLFMSIVMPLIAEFIRQTLILVFHSVYFKIIYDENRITNIWRNGYVRPHEIRKIGHTTKDEYYLELAKEATEKEQSETEQRFRLLFLAISCLVLATYNLLANRATVRSLLQHMEYAIPRDGLLAMLLLVGMFLILAIWLTLGEHDTYVYCPSLAKEHIETLERNLAELQRFQDEARNYRKDRKQDK